MRALARVSGRGAGAGQAFRDGGGVVKGKTGSPLLVDRILRGYTAHEFGRITGLWGRDEITGSQEHVRVSIELSQMPNLTISCTPASEPVQVLWKPNCLWWLPRTRRSSPRTSSSRWIGSHSR